MIYTSYENSTPLKIERINERKIWKTVLGNKEPSYQEEKYDLQIKGEFARAGIPTRNSQRIYPYCVWERALVEGSEIQRALDRACFGMLGSGDDNGRTSLKYVSHKITKLELWTNGSIYGEMQTLDTEQGCNLKALIEANAPLLLSSRGYGSCTGNVVNEFTLTTFDIAPFVVEAARKQVSDWLIEYRSEK